MIIETSWKRTGDFMCSTHYCKPSYNSICSYIRSTLNTTHFTYLTVSRECHILPIHPTANFCQQQHFILIPYAYIKIKETVKKMS